MKKRNHGEGSLLKRKNCKFWYAQFYDQNHRQVRVSTKTAVKQEALATLRKLMNEHDTSTVSILETRKLRYADLRQALIDSYVAQRNKSLKANKDGEDRITGLVQLDEFFGFKMSDGEVVEHGVPVNQLTTDAARRFVRKRREGGAGNAIINRSLACLRRMLRIAKRDGKIREVPFIEFQKEPPARKGFVEQNELDRLIDLLPDNLQPLVMFLYDSGVRVGEALQIEWSQVDLSARTIRLESEQTKNKEPRTVPLTRELVSMLARIPNKTGMVFDGTNLRKSWMAACAAAGLGRMIEVEGKPYDPHYEGLTLHDLRRSAVRNFVNAGVSQTRAMRISGHKTISVFQRYAISSNDDLLNAMDAVEAAKAKNRKKPNGAKLVTIPAKRVFKAAASR